MVGVLIAVGLLVSCCLWRRNELKGAASEQQHIETSGEFIELEGEGDYGLAPMSCTAWLTAAACV